MTKTINSEDLSLAKVFQSFYQVPDYQREYVWGEKGSNGEGGDQVDQFLQDIYSEFETATSQDAPEYFIDTIVVWEPEDGLYDLINGQRRTTASFLTFCALRDAMLAAGLEVPPTLLDQISSTSTDWQGETRHRIRLDPQYEDARSVLTEYGSGKAASVDRESTRSIRNIANAYDTICEFFSSEFRDDPVGLKRFYAYFANKVT